jgi:DNA-directed RNA polymerase subunit RPC12/RpoP
MTKKTGKAYVCSDCDKETGQLYYYPDNRQLCEKCRDKEEKQYDKINNAEGSS